jgi:hypothetical protein
MRHLGTSEATPAAVQASRQRPVAKAHGSASRHALSVSRREARTPTSHHRPTLYQSVPRFDLLRIPTSAQVKARHARLLAAQAAARAKRAARGPKARWTARCN